MIGVIHLAEAGSIMRATRLSEIDHISVPAAAPRTIRLSPVNRRLFSAERQASYPRGRSKEQGGTIVADASGTLSVEHLGGMGSTSGTFSPNLVSSNAAKFRVVGVFHTHPYDRTEGSYNGVSFSGADIAHLINNRYFISVVQSGPRLFAIVRTMQSPTWVDYNQLNKDQNAAVLRRTTQGRTFQQASRIEAEAIAPKYSLAYYQGSDGVLTRVSPL